MLDLLHLRGYRGLYEVRVVLYVAMLQDRLQPPSLLLPALRGTGGRGNQSACLEQRLLDWIQRAGFYDIVARVRLF